MDVNSVLDALRVVGDYTEEDIERYTPVAQINASLIDATGLDESECARIAYYLATKTNYEICLMKQSDSVTSFAAGDIKFTQSQDVNKAKELYELARECVLEHLEDNGFDFREV